jgi:hypothetical protein
MIEQNPKKANFAETGDRSLKNGFRGDVFEPHVLWGGESSLAAHILGRPTLQKTFVKIHDNVSLLAGWGENGEGAYAPSFAVKDDDPNTFALLYRMSMEEGNVVKLYPFVKKYAAILPITIKSNARDFYNETNDPERSNDSSEEKLGPILYLFQYFGLKDNDRDPRKVFKADNVNDPTRLLVFASRVMQERMKGNLNNIEEFVKTVSDMFGNNIYQVVLDLNKGIISLVARDAVKRAFPLLIRNSEDKMKFYSEACNLIAETGLLLIKNAPRNTEHGFFPFSAIEKKQRCPLDFYPFLVRSYTTFLSQIPQNIEEGKEYSPSKITSDVRALYNYLFKLLGIKNQDYKPTETLNERPFSNIVKAMKISLVNKIRNEGNSEDSVSAQINAVEAIFSGIQQNIKDLEKSLNIPTQKLAQFNKRSSQNGGYSVPSLRDRVEEIRRHGGNPNQCSLQRTILNEE